MEGFESFIGVDFWTALFTLINFIVTFLILKKLLFKPVKKMIDDRQQEIDGLYADANAAKKQALELKDQYSVRLADAGQEASHLIQEASRTAQIQGDEIIRTAKSDAQAILDKAERDIALEKKKAMNDMKDDISGVALSIAEKVVEKEINEEDQQQLIASFIDKLGDAQ